MKTVLVEEEYYHGLQNMACNAKARLAIAQAKLEEAQQRIAALEGALSDVESLCQFYVDGKHPSVEAAQLMNRMIEIIRAALKGSDDDR
jgi:uncharacterized protein YgfB (UPF0149 family)